MRKFLVIITIAICGLGNVNAQERFKGDVEVTSIIGAMQSFLNGEQLDGFESRNAIKFGANIDYYFNDRWSLRSGLNFDSMGSKGLGSELILNYLNIPINANWHFGSTRKWNLNFGFTPGFLLNANADGDDIKEQFESFQLGISYGIGYKLELSENFSLLFDAQGLVGITNIINLNGLGTLDRFNVGSSLNIGAVFKL
jgi:hypothetical protein